jgi:guanylate cyclase soluble subunit beta
MYGLIYSTLQSLVINKVCNGDDTKWKEICLKAGVKEPEFMNYQCYDEEILSKVVEAAIEVLDIPHKVIMEYFGGHFFEKTKVSGHSYMLRTLGHNLFGFLINLDSLHTHLSTSYIEMRAPSFQCEKTDEGLQLHYYSCRPSLQYIVMGIVKAVAKDFFNLDIVMELVLVEKLEGVSLCNHCVFDITVEETNKSDSKWIERLQGERSNNLISLQLNRQLNVLVEVDSEIGSPTRIMPPSKLSQASYPTFQFNSENDNVSDVQNDQQDNELEASKEESEGAQTPSEENVAAVRRQIIDLLQPVQPRVPIPLLPHLSLTSGTSSIAASRRGSIFLPTEDWPVNPHLFRSVFPFHIIFDKDLVIKYMGVSLSRLFPNAVTAQAKLTDYFTIERPPIPANTYQHIRSRAHNEFVIQTKSDLVAKINRSIQFRGQMVPTSSSPLSYILFIASPRVHSIRELEGQGLYLSDIPMHDVTRELILLNHQLRAEMNTASQLELMRWRLEEEKSRVQAERERADKLLHAMLPKVVAKQLKKGEEASATFHSKVTILFSDIEGFTTICNQCKHPIDIVKMLNALYTIFDSYIDEFKVYKVETIGDAYMVAAGLLETAQDHGYAVTKFAFKMRESASTICRPTDGQPLKIRIGIHTGAVMAGVVGTLMPRYCLFGDTVNVASRMESHGLSGKVHISSSTFEQLVNKPLVFSSRGRIQIKGLLERQKTYYVEPGTEYRVLEPPEEELSPVAEIPNAEKSFPINRTVTDSFVSLHGMEARGSFSLDRRRSSQLVVSKTMKKTSASSNASGGDVEVVPVSSSFALANDDNHANATLPTSLSITHSEKQNTSDQSHLKSSLNQVAPYEEKDTGIEFVAEAQEPEQPENHRQKCTVS